MADNLDNKVLVAEDDAVSRLRLTRVLESWGYCVVSAKDGDEAWRLLQDEESDPPRLAILDWMMPGLDGIDLCRRLKDDPDRPAAYIIMLTANSAPSDIVTAMDAGADDFILKPFAPEELRVRLRAGERIVKLQRELLLRASHDELTGMFNRRMLLDLLARALTTALREGSPLAVALIDLDHFKQVNDTYGHDAGDEVLREAARRITRGLRRSDLAGRYGGEEFVLVVPDCDAATAGSVAERVRQAVGDTPMEVLGHSLVVTASIGFRAAHVTASTTTASLLASADRALYRAKRAGRNRVEVTDLDSTAGN